ncbi:MAG TPA: right-handed parallel beta-helix repeat-containing protein [Candidatus Udaeobacter sp.]|jgi:hypothetical protein|nr:right-handed parallel beta-helix repeat-containing protein [Candidatus Udaeobacter sp.]
MKTNISLPIRAHLLRGALYLLLLLAVSLIPFALAQRTTPKGNRPATTITVTNTNDSGPGSLRQALADADDGDTINFDVSLKGRTIALSSGELVIDKSITITGPGSDQLAVGVQNFQYTFRIFHVMASPTVTIEGLTIGPSLYFYGCGIQNDQASLTINNCAVTGNNALTSGAGISNGGTLTINNSRISGNALQYQGTGAGILSSGTLIINNSIIHDNFSGKGQTDGGGIYSSGTLEITNSTIDGNSVGGPGGGIFNVGAAIITSSTISGNFSGGGSPGPQFGPGFGGGISNGGTLTISNSTISGNSALTINQAPGCGGGIGNSGSLHIANSTISGNSAINGGAICNNAAPLEMANSILNAGDVGQNIFNDGGTITSLGYNLSSDNGGGYLNGPGDQTNTNPILGPLQNNGGPTQTHRPYPQSPAIDAGDPNFTPPPFYDQRGPGFDRVVNGRIDIGSFEVQEGKPPLPTPTSTASPTLTPRPTPTPRPRLTPHPRP